MKNSTIRFISKLLCVVMLLSVVLEAPLMAAGSDKIAVKFGGETVNVTPGQWVTVDNGGVKTSYNVRYVNGQAVALDMKQYTSLVFGGDTAAQAAQAPAKSHKFNFFGKKTQQVNIPAKQAKSGFFKTEINEFGSKVKSGYQAGKTSGKNFSDAATQKVGGFGSKIGNVFSSAKNKIAGLFTKKNTNAKASQAQAKGEKKSWLFGKKKAQQPKAEKKGLFGFLKKDKKVEAQPKAKKKGLFGFLKKNKKVEVQPKKKGLFGFLKKKNSKNVQQQAKKEGLFSKIKNNTSNKFKSGYAAGKQMTQQGVQNVKTSLKSGFSPKNLLVTAGITVATDAAKQILSGKRPSLKKALKTVACAEFVGSTVGSVTGAAAGSFFTPFLTAIPVVGGALGALAPTFGSVLGSSVGAYMAGDVKNGRFSFKRAFANVDWAGVVGQSIGATAGAALGSMLGPVGTVVGGMVGGYVGNWAAQKLKGLFGKKKDTGYISIGMPTGSSTLKPGKAVEIGTVGNKTAEIPVTSAGVYAPEVPIAAKTEVSGTYSSDLQMAEARYKELYNLYNQMLSQGRQADAIKVAQEMNIAKSEYEKFKAKAGN